MRFGAFLLAPRYPGQDAGTPLDASLAAAVAAEDAGFDDVWIAEHHFMSYGVCPSAVTMAGFLLGATRRITVGTAVSVLSTQADPGHRLGGGCRWGERSRVGRARRTGGGQLSVDQVRRDPPRPGDLLRCGSGHRWAVLAFLPSTTNPRRRRGT